VLTTRIVNSACEDGDLWLLSVQRPLTAFLEAAAHPLDVRGSLNLQNILLLEEPLTVVRSCLSAFPSGLRTLCSIKAALVPLAYAASRSFP
jgi:hypothetical protein